MEKYIVTFYKGTKKHSEHVIAATPEVALKKLETEEMKSKLLKIFGVGDIEWKIEYAKDIN